VCQCFSSECDGEGAARCEPWMPEPLHLGLCPTQGASLKPCLGSPTVRGLTTYGEK
jgi:hypothetical protein